MKGLLQKRQIGFSLIELMIALLLGAILLLGVTQVMISSSSLGTTTNNLSVNQDRAKTVLDLLGSEAGRAGYNGCDGSDGELSSNDKTDALKKRFYAVVPLKESGNMGVMFAYGIDATLDQSDAATKLSSTDCFGRELRYRNMIYQNEGDNLRIQGRSNAKAAADAFDLVDDIIEDVQLDKVVLTLVDANGKFKEVTISTGNDSDAYDDTQNSDIEKLKSAKLITFYITVKTTAGTEAKKHEAITAIERSYSATYRLRNL